MTCCISTPSYMDPELLQVQNPLSLNLSVLSNETQKIKREIWILTSINHAGKDKSSWLLAGKRSQRGKLVFFLQSSVSVLKWACHGGAYTLSTY